MLLRKPLCLSMREHLHLIHEPEAWLFLPLQDHAWHGHGSPTAPATAHSRGTGSGEGREGVKVESTLGTGMVSKSKPVLHPPSRPAEALQEQYEIRVPATERGSYTEVYGLGHSGWLCVDPYQGKREQEMLGRKVY